MIHFTRMSDISIWPRFDYYTINFNAPNVTIVQYLWAINVRNIHEKVINFRANIRFPEMLREQISALTNSSRYCSMSVYACYFFIYSCLFFYFFLRAVKRTIGANWSSWWTWVAQRRFCIFLKWLLSRYFTLRYYFSHVKA